MKRLALVLGAVMIGTAAWALAGQEGDDDGDENELTLTMPSVPERVLAAAREAVEGAEFTEVEVEAVLVYELEGSVNGREVEIEITSEGQVIEIEQEDEEEAEDDDDR